MSSRQTFGEILQRNRRHQMSVCLQAGVPGTRRCNCLGFRRSFPVIFES